MIDLVLTFYYGIADAPSFTLRVSQAKKVPNSMSNPWMPNNAPVKYFLWDEPHTCSSGMITTFPISFCQEKRGRVKHTGSAALQIS